MSTSYELGYSVATQSLQDAASLLDRLSDSNHKFAQTLTDISNQSLKYGQAILQAAQSTDALSKTMSVLGDAAYQAYQQVNALTPALAQAAQAAESFVEANAPLAFDAIAQAAASASSSISDFSQQLGASIGNVAPYAVGLAGVGVAIEGVLGTMNAIKALGITPTLDVGNLMSQAMTGLDGLITRANELKDLNEDIGNLLEQSGRLATDALERDAAAAKANVMGLIMSVRNELEITKASAADLVTTAMQTTNISYTDILPTLRLAKEMADSTGDSIQKWVAALNQLGQNPMAGMQAIRTALPGAIDLETYRAFMDKMKEGNQIAASQTVVSHLQENFGANDAKGATALMQLQDSADNLGKSIQGLIDKYVKFNDYQDAAFNNARKIVNTMDDVVNGYVNWKDVISDLKDELSSGWDAALASVEKIIGPGNVEKIKGTISSLSSFDASAMVDKAQNLDISGMYRQVSDFVSGVFDAIIQQLRNAGYGQQIDTVKGYINQVSDIASALGTAIKDIPDFVKELLRTQKNLDDANQRYERITTYLDNFGASLVQATANVFSFSSSGWLAQMGHAMVDAGGAVVGGVAGVASGLGMRMPSFGGGSVDWPGVHTFLGGVPSMAGDSAPLTGMFKPRDRVASFLDNIHDSVQEFDTSLRFSTGVMRFGNNAYESLTGTGDSSPTIGPLNTRGLSAPNAALEDAALTDMQLKIAGKAIELGVSPSAALAVAKVESNYGANTYNSESSATGIFQVMPSTAADVNKRFGWNLDVNNPDDNIQLGIGYMKMLGMNDDNLQDSYTRKYHTVPDAKAQADVNKVMPTLLATDAAMLQRLSAAGIDVSGLNAPAYQGNVHLNNETGLIANDEAVRKLATAAEGLEGAVAAVKRNFETDKVTIKSERDKALTGATDKEYIDSIGEQFAKRLELRTNQYTTDLARAQAASPAYQRTQQGDLLDAQAAAFSSGSPFDRAQASAQLLALTHQVSNQNALNPDKDHQTTVEQQLTLQYQQQNEAIVAKAASLDDQTRKQTALTAAYAQSYEMGQRMELQLQAEQEFLPKKLTILMQIAKAEQDGDDEAKAAAEASLKNLDAETKALEKKIEAQKNSAMIAADAKQADQAVLRSQLLAFEDQNVLNGMPKDQRAAAALLFSRGQQRDNTIDLTPDQISQYNADTTKLAQAAASQAKLEEDTKYEAKREAEANKITDSITKYSEDGLTKMLDGQKTSWSDFFDSIKKMAEKMLIQLAAEETIKPVLSNIVNSFMGVGNSSNTNSMTLGGSLMNQLGFGSGGSSPTIQVVGGSTPGIMTSSGGYGGGSAGNYASYSPGLYNSVVSQGSNQQVVMNSNGGYSIIDLAGKGASLYNMAGGGSGGMMSGITSSIDAFGANYLGIGASTATYSANGMAGLTAAEASTYAVDGANTAMTASGSTAMEATGTVAGTGLSSYLPYVGAAINTGMNFANGQTGAGVGSLIGGIGGAYFGPIGSMVGSMIGGMIGGLFDGPGHGPSADARIFSGNIGSGLPLAPSSDAWLASSQNYPNYLDMMAGAGHLIKPEAGWNPNHLYADQTGEQHRNGDLTGTLSQTAAFTKNFNAMMDQYNLTLSKQWIGLLTSGDNSNPGYGSTDSMLLNLANSGAISGTGAIGSVFTNAPNSKFTQSKDLQSALQFARGIDDTLFSQNNNQYAVNARNLTSSYQSNLTQAAQYGVDTTYIDQAYNEQTLRNNQDQGMAQLKSDSSLTARQAALNGDSVSQVAATLKVTQAEEMLAAQRDHMTDTTKLAAVQQQEYAKAIEQATVKMQSANTAIYSQGMSYLGQTIPAAFATIAANSNAAILSAQQNGQDVATAQAVQNVTNFRSQIQAILSTATTQAQQLQSYLQQSGALRDTATAMGDARLTPQQAYDTAISRWREDLASAKGGNLDALSKLTAYGQSAVNAESSVYGGTQTTIYNEVTSGLNSMADQIDQQNNINATDAKQQLNQLQTIAIAANKQLTATQTSADDLKSYFDTAVSNENSALSVLAGMKDVMTAGFNGLISVSASSQVSAIQQAAVKATDTINNLTSSSTPAGPVPRTDSSSSSLSADGSYGYSRSQIMADIAAKTTPIMGYGNDESQLVDENTGAPLFNTGRVTGNEASAAHYYGIPGYASGTDFAPGGWSMVGERGPEMMYVPRGSTVVPTGGDPNAAIVAELQEMRKLLAAVGLRLADTGAANVDATNRIGVGLQTAALRPQAMAA